MDHTLGIESHVPFGSMRIIAPASTANLGSGFDCLGLALDLPLAVDLDDSAPVSERHPAMRSFRALGGDGPLSVHSKIPPGKGMGYSGAAAVAGAAAAQLQTSGHLDRYEICEVATRIEGHADNAAPSVFGGFTVAAGGEVVRLDPPDLRLVIWVPPAQTSTDASRGRLPENVSLADATFNIGRAALLVAAIATERWDVLRSATEDRVHQRARLPAVPESERALGLLLDGPALAAWLSGSGPSVAALVRPVDSAAIADSLPATGHCKVLSIDALGVRAVDAHGSVPK
jgi:homoserine kinase